MFLDEVLMVGEKMLRLVIPEILKLSFIRYEKIRVIIYILVYVLVFHVLYVQYIPDFIFCLFLEVAKHKFWVSIL